MGAMLGMHAMRISGPALLIATTIALAGCSQTHSLSDVATGLAVTVEGDYIVENWPLQAPYTAMIAVKGKDGHPFVADETIAPICVAAFQPFPENASMTQAELNALVPERAALMETEMAQGMRFEAREPFTFKDIAGYRFVVTPLGPLTAKMRIVLYVMETPRGRTVVNCSGNAETLARAMPTYDLIRDGVTPP